MCTALIIPVYNEGLRFQLLLESTVEYIKSEDTIIVDDASNDGGVDNLEMRGYVVIHHEENRGKGAALRSGFSTAVERGYSWAVTMDADGQHDAKCLPEFLHATVENRYDIIIGNRRKNLAGMPWDRRFSNLTTSLILSLISGQKIWDAQCGYRLYRLDFIESINIESNAFQAETELLLKAFSKGLKIGWVDIPTVYSDEKSHIHRTQDTLNFLKLIFKHLLHRNE